MQNNDNVKFEVLHMKPENTNSLLVTVGNDCVIFDAWGRADDWLQLLTERKLKLRAIYATHGHTDHVSAAPTLAAHFDVPWYLNLKDIDLVLWGNPLLEYFEMPVIPNDFKRPLDLTAGKYEILDGVTMVAFDSAGHSAGGMMFWFPDYDIIMVGDTLFQENVGRTDLPTGNTEQLRTSIRNFQNMNLPYQTYVVHGHGMDTTIEWLHKNHPLFMLAHCRCGDGTCCGHDHCCSDHDCKCKNKIILLKQYSKNFC